MKKDVVKIVLLTAAVYVCVPLMNLWFPMTRRYTFLLDLWLLNPVVAAAGPFGFCMRYGAAVWCALIPAVLFVPAALIFYNDTALIYAVVYLAAGLIGVILALLIRKRKKK